MQLGSKPLLNKNTLVLFSMLRWLCAYYHPRLFNRACEDSEEVRQENRSTHEAALHPEGAAAAIFHH